MKLIIKSFFMFVIFHCQNNLITIIIIKWFICVGVGDSMIIAVRRDSYFVMKQKLLPCRVRKMA